MIVKVNYAFIYVDKLYCVVLSTYITVWNSFILTNLVLNWGEIQPYRFPTFCFWTMWRYLDLLVSLSLPLSPFSPTNENCTRFKAYILFLDRNKYESSKVNFLLNCKKKEKDSKRTDKKKEITVKRWTDKGESLAKLYWFFSVRTTCLWCLVTSNV